MSDPPLFPPENHVIPPNSSLLSPLCIPITPNIDSSSSNLAPNAGHFITLWAMIFLNLSKARIISWLSVAVSLVDICLTSSLPSNVTHSLPFFNSVTKWRGEIWWLMRSKAWWEELKMREVERVCCLRYRWTTRMLRTLAGWRGLSSTQWRCCSTRGNGKGLSVLSWDSMR